MPLIRLGQDAVQHDISRAPSAGVGPDIGYAFIAVCKLVWNSNARRFLLSPTHLKAYPISGPTPAEGAWIYHVLKHLGPAQLKAYPISGLTPGEGALDISCFTAVCIIQGMRLHFEKKKMSRELDISVNFA